MTGDDRGPWLTTRSGRKFHLITPRSEEIDIEDIALSLSRTIRWRGFTRGPIGYSVAQHSVIMSHLVEPEDALWALLHDAPEAYIGDMPRPLKEALPSYGEYEDAIMEIIAERFGLPLPMPEAVREADNRMLYTEAIQLMPHLPVEWFQKYEHYGRYDLTIDPSREDTSFKHFMQRFYELYPWPKG